MTVAIAFTLFPANVFSEDYTEGNDYSDNPYKLTKQYVVYATGENALQLNASTVNINGNLYTGSNLDAYSGEVDVFGKAEVVGHLNKHDYTIFNALQYIGGLPYETFVVNEETGEEEVVIEYTSGCAPIDYEHFTEAVINSLGDDYITHEWWQTYSNTDVSNDNPIYAKSGLQFCGNTITLQDTIISDEYLLISASSALNTAADGETNLYCKNGNIGIYVGSANLNGIIYAPNGTVQICGTDININGVIIAKEILISAENVTINENYDLSLAEYLMTGEVEIDMEQDSDEDGLTDYEEVYTYKTDPFNADTDKDRLPDGYEVYILGIDPADYDTLDQGISDGEYDFDADGFTNYEEYLYGFDPRNPDTDSDGLSEWDEVYIYNTDPLNPDTDGDGIFDGDEILLGLNPCKQDSFGDGILDNERTSLQTVNNDDLDIINSDNAYILSIDITAAGIANNSIIIDESDFNYLSDINGAVIGKVFSIEYEAKLLVENIKISLKMNENEINSKKNFPNSQYFDGINRFAVFHYYEEYNIMYPVDVIYDYINDTLTIETSEIGDYFIVDLDRWFFETSTTPSSSQNELQSVSYSYNDFTSMKINNNSNELISSDFPSEKIITFSIGENDFIIGNDDFISTESLFEEFADETQPISPLMFSSPILPSVTSVTEKMKPVDVVFMVDCSDNLDDNFNNVKDQIKKIARQIFDNCDSARITVIGFDLNNAYTIAGWTSSYANLETQVNTLTQTSYTWCTTAQPLRMCADLSYRSNAQRFGVLIFDSYSQYVATNDDYYDFPEVIQSIVDKDINFSILIDSGKTVSLQEITQSLATKTGGYIGTNMGNFNTRLYQHIYDNTEKTASSPDPDPDPDPDPRPVDLSGKVYFSNFTTNLSDGLTYNGYGFSGSLLKGSDTNSDYDPVSDSDEVDWNHLNYNKLNNTYSCITMKEWGDILSEKYNIPSDIWIKDIEDFKVLSVFSNPLVTDRDNPTDFSYGSLSYNGEKYRIYVPEYKPNGVSIGAVYKNVTTIEKSFTRNEFDLNEFFLQMMGVEYEGGNYEPIQSFNGRNLYTVMSGTTDNVFPIFSIMQNYLNSVASQYDRIYIKYVFEKSGDDKRVIINVGSLKSSSLYASMAEKTPMKYSDSYIKADNTTGNTNIGYINIARDNAKKNSKKLYETLTNEEATGTYDIITNVDKRHDERYCSYLWIGKNGEVYEATKIYSEDKIEIIRETFLLNYEVVYTIDLRTLATSKSLLVLAVPKIIAE